MKAVTKIMLGGAAVAALVSAAPAAAQYPGYGGYGAYGGYGYNNGGSVVGQILNSILGGRSYGTNDRQAISMCVAATEARLNGYQGGYGYNNYGTYGGFGINGYANGYAGARVTRITNVERRSNGGLKVYGLATTGYGNGYNQGYGYTQGYGGYNNGYNNGYGNPYGYSQSYGAQLRFNCKVDYAGRVTDVDIDRRY